MNIGCVWIYANGECEVRKRAERANCRTIIYRIRSQVEHGGGDLGNVIDMLCEARSANVRRETPRVLHMAENNPPEMCHCRPYVSCPVWVGTLDGKAVSSGSCKAVFCSSFNLTDKGYSDR